MNSTEHYHVDISDHACATVDVIEHTVVGSEEEFEQMQKEIGLMSKLQHPNIVQYWGCERKDDNFLVYMEQERRVCNNDDSAFTASKLLSL